MDYAVLNRDSCVVVSGEIGCGKTTLINRFLADVDDQIIVARIFQTQITPRQLLQTLLAQFGFKPFNKNKAELLDMINRFLLDKHDEGRQVVLVVDEAQNLSFKVLEEIRLLTDIETQKAKAVNVILCGQPELNAKLDSDVMEQLAQRIHFRVHLRPLSMLETSEYIGHRLAVAGWTNDEPLFPTDIVPTLYRYTGGVPRLVNTLCDTVLTAAYVNEQHTIDDDVVAGALDELDWVPYASRAVKRGVRPGKDEIPRLTLLRDGQVLGRFKLASRRILIGRDADNDVPVASEYISRHHAQISHYRGAFWVKDLKSTNGTYINAKKIVKHRLRDRDVIALGHHRLVFRDPAEAGRDRRPDTTTDLADFRGTAVLDSQAPAAEETEAEPAPSSGDH